jgi:pullulanase/glycogen debranching enzyme
MWLDLLVTRTPASPRLREVHISGSSKRSPISKNSESQLSNCCQCSSLIRKTLHQELENYWGYGPVSFFAPHLGYSTCNDPLVCLDEFRTMVKELHRAGIEVILDVVYNHTGEGDENGPTLCFRGLENSFYYILEKDKTKYAKL